MRVSTYKMTRGQADELDMYATTYENRVEFRLTQEEISDLEEYLKPCEGVVHYGFLDSGSFVLYYNGTYDILDDFDCVEDFIENFKEYCQIDFFDLDLDEEIAQYERDKDFWRYR